MSRHHVLVIDDSDDTRFLIGELLELADYSVSTAEHGEAALALLATMESLPCLILLDVMMPVMDGPSFRRVQLADPALAKIPVIVLSADPDLDEAARLIRPNGVLKKPPTTGEIVRAVSEFCECHDDDDDELFDME